MVRKTPRKFISVSNLVNLIAIYKRPYSHGSEQNDARHNIVSSVYIRKSSLSFSLSLFFFLPMSMWCIYSVSMNFACVLKLWFLSEK